MATPQLRTQVRRERILDAALGIFARRGYREAVEQMAGWMAQGKLTAHEDVVTGTVTDFPETLLRLFRGENLGKLVLKIADA